MKELERPKIKDYFNEGTSLGEVANTYLTEPKLFKYTKALNLFIDQLESERDELKEKLHIALGFGELCKTQEQELQTLKDGIKEEIKRLEDPKTGYKWHDLSVEYEIVTKTEMIYKLEELIK